MKRASGIGHLKPFLPGLEAVLEDPEVSELMINGPGNVWVERGGELEPIEAPALTAAALYRAAIHIARPLGLDPATRPILDARLDDGSRVAICTPPASPHVAMTIRRFGGRAFSAEDLVEPGGSPRDGVPRCPEGAGLPAEHPGLRRHRLGQDHAPQRADRAPPRGGADRGHRGHARAPDRAHELPPLRGGNRRVRGARIDPRPRASTRSATGPTTSWSARSGAARPPICCRRSTRATADRSPPCTPTTPAPRYRAWPAAPCRPEAPSPGRSPAGAWSTASHLVVHMTRRRRGRRFVEEAIRVKGYDAAANRWLTETDLEEGR